MVHLCALEPSAPKTPTSCLGSVSIGIDSGAAISVWPCRLNTDYPLKKTAQTGTQYASAGRGAKHIENLGERQLCFTAGGKLRGARVQIADVRKPLMSVAEMVDAGQDVHFLASGQAYAVHRDTGEVTQFARRKNVFELDVEVKPFAKGGFSRHP